MESSEIHPIGGYFSLELPLYQEYHAEAIALNSGRFCLEYILRCKQYNKVYIPYYTCDTVIEPLLKLDIEYRFYCIDKNYRIVDDITLKEGEALLYTNYWGLQGSYCIELASKYGCQLILDYTQAFFARPINGIDTFYSCRKFFGVPDGGYLYTDVIADFDIPEDESWQRMDSLTKRIDISPEAGYDDFHKISGLFHKMPIRKMSKLTTRLMQSIDYEQVAQRRIDNYNILCNSLGGRMLNDGEVPMIFPYLSDESQELRNRLISNRIFVARYWPNVDKWTIQGMIENELAKQLLAIPCDQRYDKFDMNRILKIIIR